MLAKLRLLGCAIVAGWLLTPSPAAAQPQSDEKMERLERQVELLQKQLKAVQDEIKVSKKRAEKAAVQQAVYAATPPPAPPSTYEANLPRQRALTSQRRSEASRCPRLQA